MGHFHKNIQLILEFLKAPFLVLVLHFSYYVLITFLMMLSALLQSTYDTTLYCNRDQASDLWQLELAWNLNLV